MYESLAQQSPIFSTMYEANNRLLFQYSMLLSLVAKIDRSTVRIFHESKFGKIQEIRQKERLKRWFGYTLSFVSENPDFVVTDYPVNRQAFIDQNPNKTFLLTEIFMPALLHVFLGKETPIICLLEANKVLLDTFGLDRINFSFIKVNKPNSRLSD